MNSEESLKNLCRLYIDVSSKYQESIIGKKSSVVIAKLKAELNKLEDEIQILMTELGI
jgi:hypothetical protein